MNCVCDECDIGPLWQSDIIARYNRTVGSLHIITIAKANFGRVVFFLSLAFFFCLIETINSKFSKISNSLDSLVHVNIKNNSNVLREFHEGSSIKRRVFIDDSFTFYSFVEEEEFK